MPQNQSIYTKAVQITEDYLGPAGERFLRRQITTHLGIQPEELNVDHLPQLINWTTIAFALLTNSREDVQAFTDSLLGLASRNRHARITKSYGG